MDKKGRLESIDSEVKKCQKCPLCQTRKNTVFGVGNIDADIMLIGEGPGADEDAQGIPFVGKAGKLMNQALRGLGILRDDLYICNIVKCRPPQNRNPLESESAACIGYLHKQIEVIEPKLIILMGNVALKNILGNTYSITSARGNFIERNGIVYLPTFHPAALLRDENKKINFWQDLKLAIDFINKKD